MSRLSRTASAPLLGALVALGGCALLTGASDLRIEGGRDGASSDAPPEPSSDGGAKIGDSSTATVPDARSSGRLREITFENGSLTGPNGGDTAIGTPLVTSDGALRGKYSMLVGGPKAFVGTTFTGPDELYASFTFVVAMFPSTGSDALIARVGFTGAGVEIALAARAGALLVSAGGASSATVGTIQVGLAYRVGLHIVQKAGEMTVETSLAEGAAGSFGTGGTRIITASGGAANRIDLGSLGGESFTATFDQLLIDSFEMPGP